MALDNGKNDLKFINSSKASGSKEWENKIQCSMTLNEWFKEVFGVAVSDKLTLILK